MTILYALLSALAISAVSLLGLFFFFSKEELHGRKMHLLLALAAGAMLGNALLHMLPHALTLEQQAIESQNPPAIVKLFSGHDHDHDHDHDHGQAPVLKGVQPHDHDHDHDHDHGQAPALKSANPHDHDHDHDHGQAPALKGANPHDHDHDHDHDHGQAPALKGANPHDHDHDHDHDPAPVVSGNDTSAGDNHGGHGHTGMFTSIMLLAGMLFFYAFDLLIQRNESEGTKKVASEGWMVLTADMVENLLDGIVVGTAYAISVPVGIAATITILLHEVPLELGDYAVLRHAGFSRRRALTINFVSGLVSVVGVLVALVLGMTLDGFALYMTPLAAGGFLYIAGSILVPRLRSQCCDNRQWQYLLVSMIGVAVMVAILFFE